MTAAHYRLSNMIRHDLEKIAEQLPETGQDHKENIIWWYKCRGFEGVDFYIYSITLIQPLQQDFSSKPYKVLSKGLKCLKSLLNQLFYFYGSEGQFWFRVLGYGLSVADRSIHPPLFAERNGYVKVFRLGKWAIKPLKP